MDEVAERSKSDASDEPDKTLNADYVWDTVHKRLSARCRQALVSDELLIECHWSEIAQAMYDVITAKTL